MNGNHPVFKEYDSVELTEDLDVTLRSGTRGAIVMVYPGSPPEFEVEFVNDKGDTLSIRTVKEFQICKVKHDGEQ